MQTEDIIKSIYDYYPRNISLDDNKAYISSVEYNNRLSVCEQARTNDIAWTNFKKELNIYAQEKYGDELCDYSVLGNVPCYSATMSFGKPGNGRSWMISVLISVITPLWSYRIVDFDQPEKIRYHCSCENEEITVAVMLSSIDKYFPSYELIADDQRDEIIPNISTAFKSSPTIFEAIFKEDLN